MLLHDMGDFHTWLEVLSWAKALFDATTLGADLFKSYQSHHQEQDTIAEARRVSEQDSTFAPEEVEALLARLKACAERFIREGSGKARATCLCSVFQDAIDGNGGQMPRIDDWQNMFSRLNCSRLHVENRR